MLLHDLLLSNLPKHSLQQSILPLLTRKSSTPVGLMGLTYKTGKLMIKRIPYDLGSKGVTCSAIDFESTAGRLVPHIQNLTGQVF